MILDGDKERKQRLLGGTAHVSMGHAQRFMRLEKLGLTEEEVARKIAERRKSLKGVTVTINGRRVPAEELAEASINDMPAVEYLDVR